MGYRVMENFNYPFLARNVNDFWNRWHISLSAFARDYIYMPFVSMSRRPLIAILLTMLAIGLWHEFTARYVVWGLMHAVGVGCWHLFSQSKWGNQFNSSPAIWKTGLSIFFTFNYVVFTFALIMRDDIQQGWAACKVLLFLN